MANEKRLIDANELIEELPIVTEDKKISLYGAVADFMVLISAMPTVDAVVVVRCRDCINYNTMGCSNGFGWCEAWQQGRANESFCDCGERKDNG